MPDKKHILVYGDSLTWGIVPGKRERHAFDDRWPQVVEQALDGLARVTTEAIPGRTTVWDDPFQAGRNGRADFLMLLQSHAQVDLVVIMLGVNDLQKIYPAGAEEAADGVGLIAEDALKHTGDGQTTPPRVLIVAPPLVLDGDPYFSVMEGAAEPSRRLAGELKRVADVLDVPFFDASDVVSASRDDGVHLDREGTILLGKTLVEPIRSALEG